MLIKASYVVAPGLAILCCFCFGTIYYWYLLPWFVLSACLVLWDVGGFLVNKHFKMPPLLVKSTFFIFSFHFFLLHAWRLFAPKKMSLVYMSLEYLSVPVIVVSLSVLIYYIMDKWCSRVMKILVGR